MTLRPGRLSPSAQPRTKFFFLLVRHAVIKPRLRPALHVVPDRQTSACGRSRLRTPSRGCLSTLLVVLCGNFRDFARCQHVRRRCAHTD